MEITTPDCEYNVCGHVDSSATEMEQHGFMTPMDFEALLDAVLHSFGTIDQEHCFACYSIDESWESDRNRCPRCDASLARDDWMCGTCGVDLGDLS